MPIQRDRSGDAAAASAPPTTTVCRPPPGASVISMRYWKYRVANSSLRKYVEGKGISSEDADSAINTLSLVSALGVSSPPSLAI